MKRIAFFVEGYTEAVFIDKLIEEIAGQHKVFIEHRAIRGGAKVPRSSRLIKASNRNGQEYFVLLLDCGGDSLVKDRIQEEHENLTKSGYSSLIGIRDVRPDFTTVDIPRLEATLPKFIKTKFAPVIFILAIMEIEAWFLSEHTHFPRIDPAITVNAIKTNLGFDPENDDMEARLTPAEDLNACYSIAGKRYEKEEGEIVDTVNALDYALIYTELNKKNRYLNQLISIIDDFLS